LSELFEKGSVNISNYATLYGFAMCGFPVLSKPCCRVPSGEGVCCTVLQNGGFEIALLEVFGVSIVLV